METTTYVFLTDKYSNDTEVGDKETISSSPILFIYRCPLLILVLLVLSCLLQGRTALTTTKLTTVDVNWIRKYVHTSFFLPSFLCLPLLILGFLLLFDHHEEKELAVKDCDNIDNWL